MKRNVGGTDRAMWTVLGLGTAATRYCLLNAAIGLDTCHDGQAI